MVLHPSNNRACPSHSGEMFKMRAWTPSGAACGDPHRRLSSAASSGSGLVSQGGRWHYICVPLRWPVPTRAHDSYLSIFFFSPHKILSLKNSLLLKVSHVPFYFPPLTPSSPPLPLPARPPHPIVCPWAVHLCFQVLWLSSLSPHPPLLPVRLSVCSHASTCLMPVVPEKGGLVRRHRASETVSVGTEHCGHL